MKILVIEDEKNIAKFVRDGLKAEFLSLALILVYVGAVMVLFLFVVGDEFMMACRKGFF